MWWSSNVNVSAMHTAGITGTDYNGPHLFHSTCSREFQPRLAPSFSRVINIQGCLHDGGWTLNGGFCVKSQVMKWNGMERDWNVNGLQNPEMGGGWTGVEMVWLY